jgi:pyridoxal 5'-phosphate synthase pdxT subunit
MNIGVLALQGAYQAHVTMLQQLEVKATLVRQANKLACTDALVIPGGESSVLIKLLQENKMWNALMDYKKPILGTCAGAILLAKEVLSPTQASLNRIDITIERNAFGRQLASQIKIGDCLLTQNKIEMVFIRAPKITHHNKKTVKVLANHDNQAVAVQQGNCLATTFHPELSSGKHLHTYFIQQIHASHT